MQPYRVCITEGNSTRVECFHGLVQAESYAQYWQGIGVKVDVRGPDGAVLSHYKPFPPHRC